MDKKDSVGRRDEVSINPAWQEHNSDELGTTSVHSDDNVVSQRNGSQDLLGVPQVRVQLGNDDLDYQASDDSVYQVSSQGLDQSIKSLGHELVPGSPTFTMADSSFLPIGLPDENSTVREESLEEPDYTLISRQDTETDDQVAANDVDVTIDRAARTGHGLPDIPGSVSPRLASEMSYITDLGARGRDIATNAGQLEPTTAPVEIKDVKLPVEDRLLAILHDIPGHSERKGFFPEQTLRTLINESCVKEKLQQCFKGVLDHDTIERHTQKICGITTEQEHKTLSKKIFAILVLSQKLSAINLFIKEKVTDKDLPLQKVPRGGGSSKQFGLARKKDPEGTAKPLKCFETWSSLDIINFEEWQWTTMAPFFHHGERKNVVTFSLKDQVPLPFTADSRYEDKGSGSSDYQLEVESGFSTVFKADIHPQQHGFRNKFTGKSFAIKRLLSTDKNEFNHEAEMLMKFSDDSHEHLISLLARYEQFKKFYLIFPWAEADLESYWKSKNPHPKTDHDTVRWVAKQCFGIADGLCKIHRYESISNGHSKLHPEHSKAQQMQQSRTGTRPRGQMFGRHGDMKPQNILWFQESHDGSDKGTLKITDFGLTEINSSHSFLYIPKSRPILTPSYRPPEFDLGIDSGRSHDIWALGCIYLDFITWLLGGWDLVEKFTQARRCPDPMWGDMPTDTFFEIVRCKGDDSIAVTVKEAVSKFINDLHAHQHCSEYLHDFLNLIQMQILTIKEPIRCQQDKGRIEIGEVVHKLEEMLQKCKDPDYASESAPWTNWRTRKEAFEVNMSPETASILKHKRLQLRCYDGWVERKPVQGSGVVSSGRG